MSYKKKINTKLLIFGILTAIGLILASLYSLGFCSGNNTDCLDWGSNIGQPFMLGFGGIFIVLLVLRFLDESVYKVWYRNFAIWFVPVAALLVLITPGESRGILPLDREAMLFFLVPLFWIISALIIIFKLIQGKSGKRK